MLNVVSMCSGIEAASAATTGLGWRFRALAEIEPFPSAVLAHHYPDVPNLGDMTKVDWSRYRGGIDLVVAGTPCQAFSVAGARRSLGDDRGNLTLAFVKAVDAIDPMFMLWENVPGVLSTKDNAFGCFLGALAGEDEPLIPPGRKWTNAGYVLGPTRAIAWRTLDAQYFGLAQRRRRVFVVASPRNGPDPREILFEREGVRRDSPPRRGKRQAVARPLASCPPGGSGYRNDADTAENLIPFAYDGNDTRGPIDVATAVNAHGGPHERLDFESETFVTYLHAMQDPITLENVSLPLGAKDAGHAIAFDTTQITSAANRSNPRSGDPCHPLAAGAHAPAIAFQATQSGMRLGDGIHPTLDSNNGSRRHHGALIGSAVRRLTPRECERLQGFPDDYTLIPVPKRNRHGNVTRAPMAADGPRYKALGNSMAVPVIRWIFKRIAAATQRWIDEALS